MSEISDVVNVTVNVADTKITKAGFGIPLIFDLFTVTGFTERVRTYNNLAAVLVDFTATTKMYKCAAAIFAQDRAPTQIKVGRQDSGDASITTALGVINTEDSDFYCVVTPYKTKANLLLIAAWAETNQKIFLCNSEDADVITTVATDVATALKVYNRTGYMWHHQSGVDVTGATYTIASSVVTIDQTAHGLKIGDPVTFLGSAGVLKIDGDNIVGTVPDANTYTFITTLANQASATVNYFARYTFPEAAWVGLMLSSDPGSETWKFKTLTGVVPVPRTSLTSTEEANALSKNANLYTPLAGVGATHEGTMGTGRYIDIQRGIDWIEARIGEAVLTRLLNSPKIPYTDGGATILEGEIEKILDQAVNQNILGPLLDDSGDFYRITVPKVKDQSTTDRASRYFPGITAQAQMAGAIHSLAITVNAQV